MRGKYIVIEGPDGVGKSTLVKGLWENLTAMGVSCTIYTEPSSGPSGAAIREAIARGDESEDTLYRMFMEDRVIVGREIRETLERGVSVISDRSFLSTLAYQDTPLNAMLADLISGEHRLELLPDLAIILECEYTELIRRLVRRKEAPDHFETPEKLQKVVRNYEVICTLHLPWMVVAPTTGRTKEEVLEIVTTRCAFEFLGA